MTEASCSVCRSAIVRGERSHRAPRDGCQLLPEVMTEAGCSVCCTAAGIASAVASAAVHPLLHAPQLLTDRLADVRRMAQQPPHASSVAAGTAATS